MGIRDRLMGLVSVVADEAERNQKFAAKLQSFLVEREPLFTKDVAIKRPRQVEGVPVRRGRRERAVLDPPTVYNEGEDVLRVRLQELNLEQLRDIIAEYGMDPDKLAMKWKSPDRLIERIVKVSRGRATKGDAFRS